MIAWIRKLLTPSVMAGEEASLRRQLKELTAVHAVAAAAAESTSEDTLIERATEVIGGTLYPDNFGMGFVDESAKVLRFHHSYRGVREELIKGFQIPLGQGVTGRVAVTGQPWRIPDVTREPAYLGLSPGMHSELCVPIKIGERVIGVINAESRHLDAFSAADERLMTTFAGQLATAIEKIRLFDQVQQLAITDSLTGVSNRRHFFDLAKREFDRARRYRHSLCAIMLDIDRFKRVNDSYGHATGDEVLREVAKCCQRKLREVDLLARYGGDEFAILLPETGLASARLVADRLHQEIAQVVVHTGTASVSITASLGIGPLDDECADMDRLLQRADQALYAAKHAGRNCVRVWQADLTPLAL